jgi:hypothetical protein
MWNVRSRVSIRRLETPAGRGSGCEGVASKDDMVETEREWVFGGPGSILEIVTGLLGLG